MTPTGYGSHLDVSGTALRDLAHARGWAGHSDSSSPNRVAVSRSGPLALLVADLALLVETGLASDWWLAGLSITNLSTDQASMSATFAGGLRVSTSRITAEAAALRRATGRRSGRKPTIEPALLDRIAVARGLGLTFQAIADELERDGVPTPRSASRWSASTVRAAFLRRRAAG